MNTNQFFRSHISPQAITQLQQRDYKQEIDYKPRGFWYAVDNHWREWCEMEMPDWLHPYEYKLELDTINMLLIHTDEMFNLFHTKYRAKQTLYLSNRAYLIDWERVARDYD